MSDSRLERATREARRRGHSPDIDRAREAWRTVQAWAHPDESAQIPACCEAALGAKDAGGPTLRGLNAWLSCPGDGSAHDAPRETPAPSPAPVLVPNSVPEPPVRDETPSPRDEIAPSEDRDEPGPTEPEDRPDTWTPLPDAPEDVWGRYGPESETGFRDRLLRQRPPSA